MEKLKAKGIFQLFIIMILVSLAIIIMSIAITYNIVYESKKLFLKELSDNHTNIIKSIYNETKDVGKVLNILNRENRVTDGLGSTGEYAIALNKNDTMFFLLRMRQGVRANNAPIPLKSDIAIPMQHALTQEAGFTEGKDYMGHMVLAYCEYIPELKWGLVTKMDLSEIRSPFYKAGLYTLIISTILILLSTVLFRIVSRPISKRLAESEANYQRLFEYSAIPIWKEDYSEIKKYFDKLKASGVSDFRSYFNEHHEEVSHLASMIKITEINQKSVEFFDSESKEDVIKNMLFYFNEDSLDVFREELIVFAEGGKRFESEMPIRTLSGEIKILDMHLSVVKGYENSLSNVLMSFIDITDRKKNETALQESREKLLSVLNAVQESIYMFDKNGRFTLSNATGLKRLNNIKENDLIGHHFSEFMPDELAQQRKKRMDEVFNTGKSIEFEDVRSGMIFHHNFSPVISNNEVTSIVSYSDDITERKKIENELKEKNAELVESNATKDKFFKIVAHDMKNPFISLLGASELLYENARDYDSEKIVKLSKILNDSAKSGYDMLLNMLDWSRSQAGSIIFQPEKINLKELIDKEHSNLTEHAASKKIDLKIELPDDMLVTADKNMLNSILRNLINNAFKFTPKCGKVVVGTRKENNSTVIFVKDTGIGIDQCDFAKLFRYDIKFNRPGTDHEGGTGLGLLLCKEFVEKHGGNIWVDSKIGKGSTFYFSLGEEKEV